MLIEVPKSDGIEYPTLGPQVCDFIEERFCFGPGSLQGQPAKLHPDQRRVLYHAYEHHPQDSMMHGMSLAGLRRFQRVAWSIRKGSAKTELLAWVVACELHPDAPVRFTGYSQQAAGGLKTGRAVNNPYIPMLAYTKDQVAELGYGALMSILETCDDADMFDIGLGRIIRLNEFGRPDGKAVPLAGSPSALDGARTTMQALDETHRLYTQLHKDAIETMLNNLPKRPMEDPWQFSTTTAGEPGQGSYAEDEYNEAIANIEGKKVSRNFYFLHRQAPDGSKFVTMEQRMKAIWEATGPGVRDWTRFDQIAANWDREGADKAYLERVWTNRWTQTANQAFNREMFEALGIPGMVLKPGAFITLGFDGARFNDSTALVATEISTGFQQLLGFWERPDDWDNIAPLDENGKPVRWQVPVAEVMAAVKDAFEKYEVWRMLADPPHWVEQVADWAGTYPDEVREFWTKDPTRMYYAIKSYLISLESGSLAHSGDPDLCRHIGNAGKTPTRGVDADGEPMYRLTKITQERKYDAAVAAILSWQARMDAISENAQPKQKLWIPRRVR
ncbi:terminase large subunit [Rhodococcus phage MacGully]|nr:terminase large subunit [Rhodococcus phage MacGully]